MGIHLGVDGCKHGWVAVFAGSNGQLDCSIHLTMAAVIYAHPDAQRVFVDVPIGLPWLDCPARPCDVLARQGLGPHARLAGSQPLLASRQTMSSMLSWRI